MIMAYLSVKPSSGSGIDGTLTAGRIPFASDSDTLTDDGGMTYDSTSDLLTVTKVLTQVVVDVHNATGSSLPAGTPVYVTGSVTSNKPNVEPSDANNASTLPSVGIVTNNIGAGSSGYIALSGLINGISSSVITDVSPAAGDILYVSTTVGELTTTKPTGPTDLVQNVGRILSINGGNFKMTVNNLGRTNDVPNEIQMRSAPVVTDNSNPSASAADSGKYFYRTSGATFTLPADSYVGEQYVLLNNTGGAVTIASTGGDTIIGSTSIDDDKAATIVCVAANTWFVVG
jgi:hypothetical protein